MDYMDYDSTLPLISKSFYNGFKFYTKEQVQHALATIPDDLPEPPGYDPDKPMTKPVHSNGTKLNASETARMNKVAAAKILLLGDTRKAQAVFDFVKTMFLKDLQPIKDTTKENCLFEAWLSQISNSDFCYSNDTGELYSLLDLRLQLIYNMSVNYKEYTAKVYMHLEKPYKAWCTEQLEEDCPSDLATVAALRHIFQVRIITFSYLILYNICRRIPNSVH